MQKGGLWRRPQRFLREGARAFDINQKNEKNVKRLWPQSAGGTLNRWQDGTRYPPVDFGRSVRGGIAVGEHVCVV